MHNIKVVLEKHYKTPTQVITNIVEKPIVYPQNLAYDTDSDVDAYYMCNYGVERSCWPSNNRMH